MPFDYYGISDGRRNLAVAFTSMYNSGGPAFIGNTRFAFGNRVTQIFQSFLSQLSSTQSIGTAVALSRSQNTDHYAKLSHNLIGCPEMPVWTQTPMQFDNPTVQEYGYDQLIITPGIIDATPGDFSALVTVMSALDNGNSYYEIRGTYGNTPITFSGIVKPYYVTITRKNYIPYIQNPTTVFIQNQSFNNITTYLKCETISAGNNVTSTIQQGPVSIGSGSNIVFDASATILLDKGFQVQSGAYFQAK
jgi:hypothetical protein